MNPVTRARAFDDRTGEAGAPEILLEFGGLERQLVGSARKVDRDIMDADRSDQPRPPLLRSQVGEADAGKDRHLGSGSITPAAGDFDRWAEIGEASGVPVDKILTPFEPDGLTRVGGETAGGIADQQLAGDKRDIEELLDADHGNAVVQDLRCGRRDRGAKDFFQFGRAQLGILRELVDRSGGGNGGRRARPRHSLEAAAGWQWEGEGLDAFARRHQIDGRTDIRHREGLKGSSVGTDADDTVFTTVFRGDET